MKTIPAFILIGGALAIAGCGGSSNSSTAASKTPSKTTSAASSGGGGGGGYAPVGAASAKATSAVTMYDDYFGPKTITGKPGSTVKITLKNVGKNQHNFKVVGQKKVDADVAPGKTATVSLKIPASGSAQFFCEYHRGLGMTGTVKPAT